MDITNTCLTEIPAQRIRINMFHRQDLQKNVK